MRIHHGLVLVAALAGTASADVTVYQPPVLTKTPQGRVNDAIAAYKATRKFKGAVVVVVDHGTVHRFYYGAKDSSGNAFTGTTPLPIASNTKTFVGTTLAIFDQYTTLKRTTKLGPELSLNTSAKPYNATLEDLVDYWSGLPRDMPSTPASRTALFNSLNQCGSWSDPCLTPGAASLYSNYGFYVLGNILASRQGYAKWSDFNKYFVTEPLGMDDTCARGDGCFSSSQWAEHAEPFDINNNELSLPNYDDVTAPGGGLWSTAYDMSTWMLYNLGNIAATADQRTWLLDGVLPLVQSKLRGNAGFGWKFSSLAFADGTSSQVRWKLGRYAGFNSYVGLADDRDTGVFVFANRDGVDPAVDSPDSILRTELAEAILAEFP